MAEIDILIRIEEKLDKLLAQKPATPIDVADPPLIANEIARLVINFWTQHQKPLSFRDLSRRFGKRAGAVNFPIDLLSEHKPEISTLMNTRGGTFFYPASVPQAEVLERMEDLDLTPEQLRDLQIAEERLLAGFATKEEETDD